MQKQITMDEDDQTYKVKRYYVHGSVVPFEEDSMHEFKGHRNLSAEDVPPWSFHTGTDKMTRKAVSRAINAFLNTGRGGTVYLGIVDNGTVLGLNLTVYQKDHIAAALEDVLGRYNPPVEEHRYKLKFIPVIEQDNPPDILSKRALVDDSVGADPELRRRSHILRTHNYCWCDKDAVAQYNFGILYNNYVIEIIVKPWNSEDPRNVTVPRSILKLNPFHEDEEGNVYFRRQASLVSYSLRDIYAFTKQEVDQHYLPKIERLRSILRSLQLPTLQGNT